MFNFDFSANPKGEAILDPTISVGDTVEWVLVEGMHSTRASAGQLESWDSDIYMTAGQTFDHTFTNAGTFNYYCEVHGFDNGDGTAGGMSGTITVNAVPEPATLSMASLGVVGLLRRARRRRTQA